MITQIAVCVCDNDKTWLYQPHCITIALRPTKEPLQPRRLGGMKSIRFKQANKKQAESRGRWQFKRGDWVKLTQNSIQPLAHICQLWLTFNLIIHSLFQHVGNPIHIFIFKSKSNLRWKLETSVSNLFFLSLHWNTDTCRKPRPPKKPSASFMSKLARQKTKKKKRRSKHLRVSGSGVGGGRRGIRISSADEPTD